jgi:hypothetical protein
LGIVSQNDFKKMYRAKHLSGRAQAGAKLAKAPPIGRFFIEINLGVLCLPAPRQAGALGARRNFKYLWLDTYELPYESR